MDHASVHVHCALAFAEQLGTHLDHASVHVNRVPDLYVICEALVADAHHVRSVFREVSGRQDDLLPLLHLQRRWRRPRLRVYLQERSLVVVRAFICVPFQSLRLITYQAYDKVVRYMTR